MIDLSSRQLRAFLLVAQHRSFSRAAGALFITPSGCFCNHNGTKQLKIQASEVCLNFLEIPLNGRYSPFQNRPHRTAGIGPSNSEALRKSQ